MSVSSRLAKSLGIDTRSRPLGRAWRLSASAATASTSLSSWRAWSSRAAAELGDVEPAGGAQQQALAELLLQPRQPARDGGFGQAELVGRGGEAALGHDAGEDEQVVGVDLFHVREQSCASRGLNAIPRVQYTAVHPIPKPEDKHMNILQINGSARSQAGNSTRLANEHRRPPVAGRRPPAWWCATSPATPRRSIDEAALGALFTPAEQRSARAGGPRGR
jgi:hypothetical protein